jgi:protein subunit release factor B
MEAILIQDDEKRDTPATDERISVSLPVLSFPVGNAKGKALQARMQALGIHEKDLEERFIRGSGKGGQKINKTASCVQLTHRPSRIQVRCQEGRSQQLNRFQARRLLCDAIERKEQGRVLREEQEREKIRRQKRKRSKRAKQKMLEDKRSRSMRKENRKKPKPSND